MHAWQPNSNWAAYFVILLTLFTASNSLAVDIEPGEYVAQSICASIKANTLNGNSSGFSSDLSQTNCRRPRYYKVGLESLMLDPNQFFSAANNQSNDVPDIVQRYWKDPNWPSETEEPLFIADNVLGFLSNIFDGATVERIKNVPLGVFRLIKKSDDETDDEGLRRLQQSVLNPVATAMDIYGDVSSGIKALGEGTGYSSNGRVQVCTGNLTNQFITRSDIAQKPLGFLMPASHVGLLIDNNARQYHAQGGHFRKGDIIRCTPANLSQPVSLSAAVNKLSCVASELIKHFDYSFLLQNCGEFTKEVLEASGFIYQINPNLGIGSGSLVTEAINYSTGRANSIKRHLNATITKCNERFDSLIQTLTELEHGSSLSTPIADMWFYSLEARMSVLLASARGKNLQNRIQVENNTYYFSSAYIEELTPKDLEKKYSRTQLYRFLRLADGLDTESWFWLQRKFPASVLFLKSARMAYALQQRNND
ncbi:MAG: hypothetical protein ACXVCP_02495 [Bdellovibrio sp.]